MMRVEVRREDDGAVDEVLLYADEVCVFHLERMDKAAFWFALYPDGQIDEGEHFDVLRMKKRIEVVQR